MPFCNSGRCERTPRSLQQPRGDRYESGAVPPSRRCTRLQERCRENSRYGHIRDSSVSRARHQYVYISRHRIREASTLTSLSLRSHWAKNIAQPFWVSMCSVERIAPVPSSEKGRSVHLESWRITQCSTVRLDNLVSNGTSNHRQ